MSNGGLSVAEERALQSLHLLSGMWGEALVLKPLTLPSSQGDLLMDALLHPVCVFLMGSALYCAESNKYKEQSQPSHPTMFKKMFIRSCLGFTAEHRR